MKKNYFFLAFCLVFSLSLVGQNITADKAALVALYNSTGGANWTHNTNWNTATDLSTWYGVRLDQGRVYEVWIPGNNLEGYLPTEFGNLTALVHLNLDNNSLSGSLPASMANLTSLDRMFINGNDLSGSIPSWIDGLTSVREIGLGNNNFSGTIPSELFNLTSLTRIDLNDNQLSGDISEDILKLTSLSTFNIARNQFTSLPILTSLPIGYLDVYGNMLTFEDLLPNKDILTWYHGQAKYGVEETVTINVGETLNLDRTLVGDNNNYEWNYNDYTSGWVVISNERVLNKTAELTDAGLYVCVTTNPDLPALSLISNQITVVVNDTPIDDEAPVLTTPESAELIVGFNFDAEYAGPFATAVDNEDPSPVVVSNPALPVIYTEPGTYQIKWTATDESGNFSESFQTITVTPSSVKAVALTVPMLEALQGNANLHGKTAKKIKDAIKELEKVLRHNSSWLANETQLDTKKGKHFFHGVEKSAKKLKDVIKDKKHHGQVVAQATLIALELSNTCREIAMYEIDLYADLDLGKKETKEIEHALKHIKSGDAKLNKKDYDKAIKEYSKAWEIIAKIANKIKHEASDKHHKGTKNLKALKVSNNLEVFNLKQNYPNPFTAGTTLDYSISNDTKVVINIYNIQGQVVKNLVNENQISGTYSVKWNGKHDSGSALPRGIYFVTLVAENQVRTIRMIKH